MYYALAFFMAVICDAFDETTAYYFYALFTTIVLTEKSILSGLKSTAWIAITIPFLLPVVAKLK
jgi:hypothetical protein